jgi:hypothetical protein
MEQKEVLDVEDAHQHGEGPRGQGHPVEVAEQLKEAEPGRHEGEIHQPRNGHEDAADDQHAGAALLMNHEG